MILVILDAAIRGLVLALVVWAGLVALRVRNVMAQKVAWGLVLAAALLMPWLSPLAVHLRRPVACAARHQCCAAQSAACFRANSSTSAHRRRPCFFAFARQ